MTASLQMYDTSSTQAANDRLWQQIRAHYGHGPDRLLRGGDPHALWHDPALVLSQTCGLPYRSELKGKVTLVGTPDYGLRGCPPGYYKSYLLVRKDDPRRQLADFKGATLARNDVRSQSGWAAIENHLVETDAGFSFQGHTLDTCAHAASAQAVVAGHADIAAIDALTWTLLKRDTDLASMCRVLTSTRPTPGLPYITAKGTDPEPLFQAITVAIRALSARDRARLLLKGIVKITPAAYFAESIPNSAPRPDIRRS